MKRAPAKPIKVDDYRYFAERKLPKIVFDFVEGGAEDETGLAHNRGVFDQIRFRPRRFVDIDTRSLTTDLFGKRFTAPLAIAPTGLNAIVYPKGDLVLAQAAAAAGIPFILSTAASMSIEDIARNSDGERWFQLYVFHRDIADDLVDRALAADYSALVLTTDVGINGYRERDLRNDFVLPMRYSPKLVLDGALHLPWSLNFMRHGVPIMANLKSPDALSAEAQAALMSRKMDTSYDWDDLKRLRDRWPRPLLVKGILDPADAARCFEIGVDGVILSNHGGRQLDAALSPMDVLRETATRVAPGAVLADSGFRRGADVVKALALGARMVLLGRATLYGLAACGRTGVDDVLRLLKNEIDGTLAQIGCPSIADLGPDYVTDSAALVRCSSSIAAAG